MKINAMTDFPVSIAYYLKRYPRSCILGYYSGGMLIDKTGYSTSV